jgi:hypothetical protein
MQDVVVFTVPAEGAARVRQQGEHVQLVAADAVLREKLPELLGADATFAGLDPADL